MPFLYPFHLRAPIMVHCVVIAAGSIYHRRTFATEAEYQAYRQGVRDGERCLGGGDLSICRVDTFDLDEDDIARLASSEEAGA